MKFKYYITDTHNGCIKGTNNQDVAKDISYSCDYFVVNSETGEWLTEDGELQQIEDIES